jgi:hypothetical protein
VLAAVGGCGAENVAATSAVTSTEAVAEPAQTAAVATTEPPTTAAATTLAPTTTRARPKPATTRHATATTRQAPPATARSSNCDPAYSGACLHDGIGDYDCAGGSGNGPNYVTGPIRVRPPDPFGLDRDGDGIGCES